MTNNKDTYLYTDEKGNEVWGTTEEYWEMKGYITEKSEKPKKKHFWNW